MDIAVPAKTSLDVEDIKKLLPHRAPFLFVEKLTDIVPKESAVGWKAVSFNEPHFAGHFPSIAVMPGVLIIEAMAQAAGALVVHSLGLSDQKHQCVLHDRRQSAVSQARRAGRSAALSRQGDPASRAGVAFFGERPMWATRFAPKANSAQ